MPWKGEKDPYLIWLSEIILQQTRVQQGWDYYLKFKDAYPRIEDLANAPEDEVMKNWQGLGYYNRARNMHATAKYVTEELDGNFPTTFEAIRALKGVGDYTAAAIASFAFGLPHAVVDGNVIRVLSRFFGIEEPVEKTTTKATINSIADSLLSRSDPAAYNQAIMEFGSTICKPKNAECTTCPVQGYCQAYESQLVEELPRKSRSKAKRKRYFYYIVLKNEDDYWIEKRVSNDIWQGLYQFPLIESDTPLSRIELLDAIGSFQDADIDDSEIEILSEPIKQTLSHQVIIGTFIVCEGHHKRVNSNLLKVTGTELFTFAYPKIIDLFLGDYFITSI